MADIFVKLLGSELLDGKNNVKTEEALNDKVVGLYFSAHWCGPCRSFTPELAKSYSGHLAAKGFEIVFVSSDKDEKGFEGYYADMPWKALPFAARDRKQALSKKFDVDGIPTLVILDKDGSVITKDARSNISADPKGEDFPWKPKSLEEILGSNFTGSGGATLDKSAIEGKVLGLYFSAHWCGPCCAFTPKLADWYKKIKPNLPDFEIVFISSDRSKDAFNDYFAEMPWIALPYDDRKAKTALSERFEVRGIPTFVIVDKDGTLITSKGRSLPMEDPEGKQFPWYPKPVQDMASGTDGINKNAAFVVLTEGADEATRDAIVAAIDPVAKEAQTKAKESAEDPMLFFFTSPAAQGTANKIRSLTGQTIMGKHVHSLKEIPDRKGWSCDGCGERNKGTSHTCKDCNFDYCVDCHGKSTAAPIVGMILDIPQGVYYAAEGIDLKDADSIRQFIAKYTAGTLTKSKLGFDN